MSREILENDLMYKIRVYKGRSSTIRLKLLHRLPAGGVAWPVNVREMDVKQVEHVDSPERSIFKRKYSPNP